MIQAIALQIKNAINNCLPGEVAHLKMSSAIRMNDFIFRKEHENSKKCGVLILLFPFNNKIYSALILRAEYDGIHSGQVALPGGKYEKTDLNIIQTAIRETSEEIGVKMNDIHIIGSLTKLYIPPSDYIVYPSIGYVSAKPEFIPDSNEEQKVDRIFMIHPEFLDSNNKVISEKNLILKSGEANIWILTPDLIEYHKQQLRPGYKGYFVEEKKVTTECEIIEILR